MVNILICDDEKDIVRALKIYLSDAEYRMIEAANGQEAVEKIQKEDVHLAILDIMMPVMDGIEATAKIREFSNIPIILLTAKSEDSDIVLGLNVGADDYITKPFNPVEVSARVKSQLRRYFRLGGGAAAPEILSVGGIELSDRAKRVTVDGENVSLTPTEFEILKLMMQNQGKVFSPQEIYREAWKEPAIGSDNTVAVHIRHLREKVEVDPANPRYIKVIFGRGYYI